MGFLITNAWAAGGVGGFFGGESIAQFLPLIVLLVVFYFLLIRPQMKRAREHRELIGGLSKGDEVVTNGGLLGRVVDVGDNYLSLEVADGVQVKVQKPSVSSVLPKGTMKSF